MIFSDLVINSKEPIYLQIQEYIKTNIKSHSLMARGKLPSTRELSVLLGVSRSSVIIAYENLIAENYIYTLKGKGTFISPINLKEANGWEYPWSERINSYGRLARDLDIVKSEIPWKKNLISFKSISPPGELFDTEEVKRAFLNRFSLEGDKLLGYGYAKGYKPLMDYISSYMQDKGMDMKGKDIIITNGFTEALEIVLSTFTKPGDKILCENPTHNTAIKIMKVLGLIPVGVTMGMEGIDIEELERKLCQESLSFGFLIPSYHNPTGIVISAEKRRKVYELFRKHNVPIIEDGFNEELLHNSSQISPIAALDKDANGVVYMGSFSKVLFPGLRIGWVIADKAVIDILESAKRCKNIHTSFLDQGILYEYMISGAFEKQLKKIRSSYRNKYKIAINAIEKYIKPSYNWGEAGFYVYIGLKSVDSRELLKRCYERGVIFMPGDIFSLDDSCSNTLRLGLSRLSLKEIEEGIKIIGECLQKTINIKNRLR